MPATLPQETGDHNSELGSGWRAQDEIIHGELMDGDVIREVTSATRLYSCIIKT